MDHKILLLYWDSVLADTHDQLTPYHIEAKKPDLDTPRKNTLFSIP